MEQLVDIVQFLHFEIHNAFGTADTQTPVKSNRQNLGEAGLALHYANIISQIDTLVTHSGSVSPHTRDSLYQGLPHNIKLAIRSKLHWFHPKEEVQVNNLFCRVFWLHFVDSLSTFQSIFSSIIYVVAI
ncbi:hypothetical protein HanOQP8_Chr11g0388571 [Helianthus annuus]|nr:hypothetical protein HanOQP8_Chr11g0388571 [Helianthus annuus]